MILSGKQQSRREGRCCFAAVRVAVLDGSMRNLAVGRQRRRAARLSHRVEPSAAHGIRSDRLSDFPLAFMFARLFNFRIDDDGDLHPTTHPPTTNPRIPTLQPWAVSRSGTLRRPSSSMPTVCARVRPLVDARPLTTAAADFLKRQGRLPIPGP